ncbi:hypothetical protein Sango_2678500 [Sesamum angolense]|uniref:Retrotransposon Copia-like N-terminal domain-containing protein n=1 Tax=Sesamum angolense TaxID=2727404 RepID=A0AAE1W2E1_9LAMI|nr:hypothetical protein Sango_2678500 [Sesamum angolense]
MGGDSENLKIQPSDNPRMSLVSNPLNGRNFQFWSRSIKIALGATMKLGFINGKIPKPAEDDERIRAVDSSGLHGHFLAFKLNIKRYGRIVSLRIYNKRIVGRVGS